MTPWLELIYRLCVVKELCACFNNLFCRENGFISKNACKIFLHSAPRSIDSKLELALQGFNIVVISVYALIFVSSCVLSQTVALQHLLLRAALEQ